MNKKIKIHNKYLWILLDMILLHVALFTALLPRFGIDCFNYYHYYRGNILLISLLYLFFSALLGLYNYFWRYISIKEILTIIMVVLLTFLSSRIINYIFFDNILPRTVFFLFFFFSISAIIGNKLLWRFYHENRLKVRKGNNRILVVGAGDAGDMISREIRRRTNLGTLVGFVDDDLNKNGMSVHGVKVLGTTEEIPQIVRDKSIDRVIIAIPSASGKRIRKIVNLIPDKGIDIKTLPGLYELVDGQATYSKVRDLKVEDILGREPINLQINTINDFLTGKIVLVSGAGGSIGSEIARQLCNFNPKSLILLDNSENNLYNIFCELNYKYEKLELVPLLLNITNKNRLKNAFQTTKPDVIFHAAAHKHVPILEYYPDEAVWNNVVGTKNITEIADEYQVERMIMISTDKAVNPTSVMGVSKRIAEMVVTDYGNKSQTQFMAVRFGNVLDSSGSVVPLFRKQIAQGGPVTVTDKEVKRYFMTIPEASQLVIQAGALGNSGKVFVLEMGEPVKVYDLAVEMIKLMGFQPEKDIEIKIIGLRPGEKLFEELLTEGERSRLSAKTEHEKIYIADTLKIDSSRLEKDIEDLLQFNVQGDYEKIIKKMQVIVPNYKPNRDLKNLRKYSW
jgi:FlaA1/EpsC-like NDP-sugar epimerase